MPAGPLTHDSFRALRSFSALDGLRCLSILAVVWHHARDPSSPAFLRIASLGFLGVDLFFELSGFLIVTLLLRERDARGGISLSRFYARRALRILPLYYGVLALVAIQYLLVSPGRPEAIAFRHDLPFLFFYLTNWFPAAGMLHITWSLAAEQQFYAFWPPIERWAPRATTACAWTVIVVGALIQSGLLDSQLHAAFGWGPGEPAMLRESTFTPICLGVLLAHWLHDPKSYERLRSWFGFREGASVCLAALIVLASVVPEDIRGWARPLIHLTMLCLLLCSVLRTDTLLHRALHARPIVRIGELSYGIYLLHPLAVGVAVRVLAPSRASFPMFVLALLGSLVLAELSFRFYESRFLLLKQRFGDRAPRALPLT